MLCRSSRGACSRPNALRRADGIEPGTPAEGGLSTRASVHADDISDPHARSRWLDTVPRAAAASVFSVGPLGVALQGPWRPCGGDAADPAPPGPAGGVSLSSLPTASPKPTIWLHERGSVLGVHLQCIQNMRIQLT